MQKVIVTVSGGIATVVQVPDGIETIIVDFDNEEDFDSNNWEELPEEFREMLVMKYYPPEIQSKGIEPWEAVEEVTSKSVYEHLVEYHKGQAEEELSPLHKAIIEEIEYMFRDGIMEDEFEEQLAEVEKCWNESKSAIVESVVNKLNFHEEIFEVFRLEL